jgi:serine/threonine protein kinase
LSEEAVVMGDTDSEPDDESMAQDSEILVGTPLGEAPAALPRSRPRHATSSKKKKSAYQTYGRCGTPDYLAPEIISREPHGPPVDYWALGIILYEMLVGFPPFNDDTVDAIFDNIVEGQILWPDGEKSLSIEAMDLIDKLLDRDPATRMGWEGIKLHPFFDGINWDTILESVPPFVPTLEGPNDTSYFNNRNLTDIFIDDDEFDVASRSASSSQNNLDSGPESDEQLLRPSDPKGEEDDGAGNNSASNLSASTADVDMSWGTAGALSALEGAGTTNENLRTDGMQVDDDNNHYRFPSGMYGSPHDGNLADAFRSFSFTNMNALAAASQAEADMITDSEQEVAGAVAGPSILI